jgi:P27 family predicted phage terminase small subunit
MKKPPPPKTPPAPPHLSPEARDWWERILREWVLDDPSLLLLQAALESFDRMNAARLIVEAEGIVVRDRWGQLRPNPAVLAERDSRTAMCRALKQLGLDLEPLGSIGRPPGGS